MTASKHHRIKVEIDRKMEDVYSVELRLDTGDGRVRIFNLLLEGSVLEELGFDLSTLDDEEYNLRRHPGDPELIKVSEDSDEDEDDDSEEEDESEEEDDSEEEDVSEDGLEEPLQEEFIEDAVVELVGYLSGLDVFGFE